MSLAAHVVGIANEMYLTMVLMTGCGGRQNARNPQHVAAFFDVVTV